MAARMTAKVYKSRSKYTNKREAKQNNSGVISLTDMIIQNIQIESSKYDKSVIENVAWLTQHHTAQTCEVMYKYIQTHDLFSPMSLAAVWRIRFFQLCWKKWKLRFHFLLSNDKRKPHCKKCGFKYHPLLVALPGLAEYYIRFGGNIKLLYSSKPKRLIRDVPAIRAALAKNIKADLKMKPGAVKCIADNLYLFDQLGDVACLAGMIDPEYVSHDPENILLQRLLHFKAYDSIPPEIAYQTMIENKDKNNYMEAFYRAELLNIYKDPSFEQNKIIYVFAHSVILYNVIIQQQLAGYHPNIDTDLNELTDRLLDSFLVEADYKNFINTKIKNTIIDVTKKLLPKKCMYEEKIFDYLLMDTYPMNVTIRSPSSPDVTRVIIWPYHYFFERNEGEMVTTHNPIQDQLRIDLRNKTIGKDWRDKPALTAVEIRAILIEQAKQKILEKMSTWRFDRFANCDFMKPKKGGHPIV